MAGRLFHMKGKTLWENLVTFSPPSEVTLQTVENIENSSNNNMMYIHTVHTCIVATYMTVELWDNYP